MVHVIITFTIDPANSLEVVKQIIQEFIVAIRQNEPDTLLYRSFQEVDKPYHFYHIMTFANAEAQQLHRDSSYCSSFVKKLYPLCSQSPEARSLAEIPPM
ncbi:MAG: antibiotic biosynthesis monooxygenase [Saprospiraceae bacterium]|nr:antibiotic biosynthesis monooxygenase [Saprospiraceae bacterium]